MEASESAVSTTDTSSGEKNAAARKGSRRRKDWRKDAKRRGSARRGGRKRNRRGAADGASPGSDGAAAGERPFGEGVVDAPGDGSAETATKPREGGREGARTTRSRRRGRDGRPARRVRGQDKVEAPKPALEVRGMLVLDRKGIKGFLREESRQFLPHKDDVGVSQKLVQRYKLRDGCIVEGKAGRGQGKVKRALVEVGSVDGKPPKSLENLTTFKRLTSIDPDFHYAMGDEMDDVSLRIIDVLCPVGRGTRGLIVAPPRSGKTILMQKFAGGMEKIYPEVHLMVLLVDERPEEATEWRRTTGGQVFVSTNDEPAENHVNLAEAVWARCKRLVELGEDVVLVMDSITRLARAYNNTIGYGSGRTMSGGIDSKTMERPKQFFGSARNTETAGSLTILGTTLVETGSRMDQVIFEEFKGTGNMELVLSRKLADRRVFPAIDIERSGTRKEEKLISAKRLKRITTLRRVLARMHYLEAMELLITKLEEVEKNDDFLKRFEVDPDI